MVLLVAAFSLSYRKRFSILVADSVAVLPEFPQISGIVYWPEHATLIGVGDGADGLGQISEFTLNGKMIRTQTYAHYDLKDIMLSGEQGYAIVTDERARRVLKLRLSDLAIVEDHYYPRFPGQGHNHQFEGITKPKGAPGFVFANENNPTGLVYFSDLHAPPDWVSVLGAKTVSSVITDDQGNLLLVSRDNGLLLTTQQGSPLGEWHPVRGSHMEGVAAFAWSMRRPGSAGHLLLLSGYFCLGLALMSKGPIALVFVVLGVWFLHPKRSQLGRRSWVLHGIGIFIALLPLLLWVALVVTRLDDAIGVWRFEVIGRLSGTLVGDRPLWFYGPVLLGAEAPLMVLFIAALFKRDGEPYPSRAWFLSGMLFLMLLSTRSAAYILPLLPAAAILTAQLCCEAHRGWGCAGCCPQVLRWLILRSRMVRNFVPRLRAVPNTYSPGYSNNYPYPPSLLKYCHQSSRGLTAGFGDFI